ncbi:multidrug efflux RND transporter permease subunit [Acinetobacter corruptisaponis]|uniref:Efflux pump membrane transporter n=1 Tax=Acinetobacter corruptisaponis TaxID=3045147 RepID=A0ABY8S5W5_9GAMM|nr:multidrug efflux RND transporter permease subunit [Acinetobacter sp. KCTC 92772]WHP06173.1 multidrug efflux RND transporter permease subunit [Acinetobacter sp. KCTC 92772]
MLPRFFIYHPIFASVIAIIILILGFFSILALPVERYPNLAPPSVSVSAVYRGASAETVEESVTQILEQQIKGIDNLLYYTSNSESSGRSSIDIHFKIGTDIDKAQVQVQNQMNSALSRLPEQVQRQGVNIWKTTGDLSLIVGIYDETGKTSNIDLSDYLITHFEQPLTQIQGVGEVDIFGSAYAMRIWLNPNQLRNYKLMPSDIEKALSDYNTQIAAGSIGAMPSADHQNIYAKVTAGSRLKTIEDFKSVVVKANIDGSLVYLKDVARVELGAENYESVNRLNGFPSAGLGIYLSPDANAIQSSKLIKEKVAQLSQHLPAGYKVVYPRDNTPFIQESIKQVIFTLLEAVVLVVLVMYLFLQNWRATLIPTITVPIVICGTFIILYLAGMSINTLTLFALVLAIGLLVDDTIVVVENVERLIHEKQLEVREACLESMQEISGALIGITLVLTAVFIPMAFFSGSTGMIYRQFSITLVAAMLLSLIAAMMITPALCAVLLKKEHKKPVWGQYLENGVNRIKLLFIRSTQSLLRFKALAGLGVLAIIFALILFYRALPTSFIPNEDQGLLAVQFALQDSASLSQTQAVGKQVNDYLLHQEAKNINTVLIVNGQNFSGQGPNLGMAFVSLKHWDERQGAENTAPAIRARLQQGLSDLLPARVMVGMPASVSGLGQSDAIELWLRDVAGKGRENLQQQFADIEAQAKNYPAFTELSPLVSDNKAALFVQLDQNKAKMLGIEQQEIRSTLSTAWGGSYVNDFVERGRIKRIIMQGDTEFRSKPEDLRYWHVRNQSGEMLPLSHFAQTEWTGGPEVLNRFMGLAAIQLEASVSEGFSSGQAMGQLSDLIDQQADVDLAWSGLSLQEQQSSNQAIYLYVISILFIFLCLAALYESWKIPFIILLGLPLGITGTILCAWFFDLPNDVYFQIALLTAIGLSCKNAILIVEFASTALTQGLDKYAAAYEALSLRLRPIIMTSLAFGAGIIPLVFATGAGAASRYEIGISVLGSVIFGTILIPLFTAFLFVLVHSWVGVPKMQWRNFDIFVRVRNWRVKED